MDGGGVEWGVGDKWDAQWRFAGTSVVKGRREALVVREGLIWEVAHQESEEQYVTKMRLAWRTTPRWGDKRIANVNRRRSGKERAEFVPETVRVAPVTANANALAGRPLGRGGCDGISFSALADGSRCCTAHVLSVKTARPPRAPRQVGSAPDSPRKCPPGGTAAPTTGCSCCSWLPSMKRDGRQSV